TPPSGAVLRIPVRVFRPGVDDQYGQPLVGGVERNRLGIAGTYIEEQRVAVGAAHCCHLIEHPGRGADVLVLRSLRPCSDPRSPRSVELTVLSQSQQCYG